MAREPISWDISVPLLTNPHIAKAWIKAMAATYLLCMVIMVPIFLGTGEAEAIPQVAGMFLAVVLGITLMGFLIMLVVFGNRSHVRFIVSDKGITYRSMDKKAMALSRMAVVAGGLTGNPSAAGAGVLSIANETVDLKWSGAFTALYRPKSNTILLRNQYRDLLHIYCLPENYEAVRALVHTCIAEKGTAKRLEKMPSPFPKAIGATVLVLLACLPLYALNELTDLSILAPLILMAFSLAMVWLIHLFAWVVLVAEAYILLHTVSVLGGLRTYTLISTYSYRKFEVLDTGEWLLVVASLIGLAYLAWRAVRYLKGKSVPVLMGDTVGMG